MIYVIANSLLTVGHNPGITGEAGEWAESLRRFLPAKPGQVVSGTGRMHLELARALGVTVDRYSSIFGCGDRRIVNEDGAFILLSDGTEIPASKCTSVEDRHGAFMEFMRGAMRETIVITNRGSTRGILGIEHPAEPTIIKLHWVDGKLVTVDTICR